MTTKHCIVTFCIAIAMLCTVSASAQEADTVTRTSRLIVGGYGEAVYSYHFYSGDDLFTDPTGFFVDGDSRLPRYPHQKIWPYSDFVQHKLHMVNDIRTGWCRTTPLWGRGLAPICSGHADRLHDCRARNVIEAIMWHGSQQSDARRSVVRFRELSKADRDAIVRFIDAI